MEIRFGKFQWQYKPPDTGMHIKMKLTKYLFYEASNRALLFISKIASSIRNKMLEIHI